MSFVVSARKYRPQNFDQVLGQEHITDTLKSAILSDKLAHAFLFTGPRGVGKTTCARIMAKIINAPDPKKAITDEEYGDRDIDVSLNIFELDAASNNSVEHIRNLIEQVRFQPQVGKFKVFIIDEVHMLSQAAFNAFLKTLEEPPEYAIFILATTEKHKILPTILSRCQIFDFKRIAMAEMIQQLDMIGEREQIKIDDESKYVIAEMADGAMRDALSIFDRLASSSDGEIKYEDLVKKLNLLDQEYYFKMTDALLRQDRSSVLQLFNEILMKGFEGDHFINGLADHFRNILLCQDPNSIKILEVSDAVKQRYAEQSQLIDISYIMTALHLFNECDIQYPKAKNKRLHVEISLLKACYVNNLIIQSPSLEKKTPDPNVSQNNSQPIPSTANANQAKQTIEPVPQVPADLTMPEPDQKQGITSSEVGRNMPTKEAPVKATEIKKTVAEAALSLKSEIIVPSPLETPEKTTTSHSPTNGIAKIDTEIQNTPSLSSLDSLLSEVKADIDANKTEKKELTVEAVTKIWDEYKAGVEVPSTRAVLDKSLLTIVNQALIINVPSGVAKEMLQQELLLMQDIRSKLHNYDLDISINIDKELFPKTEVDRPKKYLAYEDKLELMINKNPHLTDLIKKLDLKKDNNAL